MTRIDEYAIESDVEVGGATIKAITDGEQEEDVPIIGHLISYTIGSDFTVPRDWLKERAEELELTIWAPGEGSKLIIPPKVTPKSAFNRTRDRLIDEVTAEHSAFQGDGVREIGGRETQFETKKESSDQWHITAEAFFTAEELNKRNDGEQYEDGEFRQTTVGVMRYQKEHEGILTVPKVEKNDPLRDSWNIFATRAMEMFRDMQESHIGRDIQLMCQRFVRDWTDTIKVRDGGAVYFVPAGYDKEVRALKTLIDEIDEKHKDRGRDCELLRISVTDSDEERKQIEEKAQKHLRGQVEEALDSAFDALAEDEAVAEEVAEDLQDRLSDLEGFAGDYNALLSAKLSAQSVLKDVLSDLEGSKEDLVERVLDEEEEAIAAA